MNAPGSRVAPKSRAGVRDVPIAGVLRDYLSAHKLRSGRSDGLVFGRTAASPFNPSSVAKRAAAAWAKANADEIVSFTLDRYARVFEKLEQSEMERIDDFLALADIGSR